MHKLCFAATRAWVGDCAQDASHAAELPTPLDARWILGTPDLIDTDVLTISPFYPSGRLGVCVERQSSQSLGRNLNHPPFAGAVAWMPLDGLRLQATPLPVSSLAG